QHRAGAERDRLAGPGRRLDRHPLQGPRPTAARVLEQHSARRGEIRQSHRRPAAPGGGRDRAVVASASHDAARVSTARSSGSRGVRAWQLKIVALGLAVLLLLWGGSELFSRGSDTVTGSFVFPAVAPADVDSIAL